MERRARPEGHGDASDRPLPKVQRQGRPEDLAHTEGIPPGRPTRQEQLERAWCAGRDIPNPFGAGPGRGTSD